MKLEPGERQALAIQKRSLQEMSHDLQRYKENGSKTSHAKLFNNVIDGYLFDLPLSQVSIE